MSDELNEIWALYADDGHQALDAVEEALLALKEEPSDAGMIASLFRAMHTFKGNSRILGLATIEGRAHLAEDLIGLVRDEGAPLDPELVGLLLQAADAFRGMMEETLSTRRDVDEAPTADLAQRMRDKYDRCKQGNKNPAPANVQPEYEEAILFAPEPARRLADDPAYRQILLEMTGDTVRELREALANAGESPVDAYVALTEGITRLRHAAEQIQMPEWPEFLAKVADKAAPSAESIQAAIDRLAGLCNDDMAVPEDLAVPEKLAVPKEESGAACDATPQDFLQRLAPLLNQLAELGSCWSPNGEIDRARVTDVSEAIRRLAEAEGFAGVAELAREFPAASANAEDFRRQQFKIYEALALIENNSETRGVLGSVDANTILRTWCVDNLQETIFELSGAVEKLRQRESVIENCGKAKPLLRKIYHVCRHYNIDSAGQLAWAIIDLLDNVLEEEAIPDPVVLHILKSYLTTVELLFEKVDAGEAPNMSAVEELFQEASAATFAVKGTLSATQLEARLGLPKSFHNVLTPESVRTALASIGADHHFYIIRADLNQDEQVAERFLGWFGSGAATAITNVTFFEGDKTLFDFLVSSALGEAEFAEALGTLDPEGLALRLQTILYRPQGGETRAGLEEEAPREEFAAMSDSQDVMSNHMLESIGEIVTGHAMVQHMLGSFAEEDMFRTVEGQVRAAGGDWSSARESVRQYLQGRHDTIERLGQIETQLLGRIDRLQEEAIAVRTRSASLLLRPLTPFGEALAHQNRREAEVSTAGEDVSLDISMIEQLKGPLHQLVSFCVTESVETPEERIAAGKNSCGHVRVVLVRTEDSVAVTVEDDGRGIDMGRASERVQQLGWSNGPATLKDIIRPGYGKVTNGHGDGVDFSEVQRSLRLKGGDLRMTSLPGGGVRFHATMRLAMVVLDGMVVRVGEVMYVVPIDAIQRIVHSGGASLVRVSADGGRYMLQLGRDDVLPVQFLTASNGGSRFGGRDGQPPRNGNGNGNGDADAIVKGRSNGDEKKWLFVVAGKQSRRVAISIDELVGQQLVLIRPLQGYLSSIRGVSGCALLGSGGVGMVLDVGSVLGSVLHDA